MRYLFVFIMILGLSSCSSSSKREVFQFTTDYNEKEIAWSKKSGRTTTQGSSFILDRLGLNGSIHPCAGYTAQLYPKSKHVEEYFNYIFDNLNESFWDRKESIAFKTHNSEFGARESKCDADGKFEFKNVPNGTYYITTTVYYIGGPLPTIPPDYKGGIFLKKVKVKGEPNLRVVLSN